MLYGLVVVHDLGNPHRSRFVDCTVSAASYESGDQAIGWLNGWYLRPSAMGLEKLGVADEPLVVAVRGIGVSVAKFDRHLNGPWQAFEEERWQLVQETSIRIVTEALKWCGPHERASIGHDQLTS